MKQILKTLFFISFSTFSQEALFVASDFTKKENEFTGNCEGPSVDKNGNIYAVNINQDGTIAKISPNGETSVFLTLPNGSIGNGIRFGSKNVFFVADFKNHNVLKVDLTTKNLSVLVNEPKMNQPNDLAIMKNGTIFCSDPNWKNSTGQIWKVTKEGKAELVATEMGTSNGIEVSPDEKTLFVNESVQLNVWAFDILPDGKLGNKRLFHHFEDGGMDGMRCDNAGNLYITRYGKGEIAILNPEGKLKQIVKTKGLKTSNICFGGKDGKTCYVTLQDRKLLETFRTDTAGREFMMMKSFK